jgi:hypothetical protein
MDFPPGLMRVLFVVYVVIPGLLMLGMGALLGRVLL